MSGVRRSSNGGSSSCTPVGRRKHPFVQGDAAIDPPEWKPAEPPGHGRRRGGARGSGAAPRTNPAVAGVLSLQARGLLWGLLFLVEDAREYRLLLRRCVAQGCRGPSSCAPMFSRAAVNSVGLWSASVRQPEDKSESWNMSTSCISSSTHKDKQKHGPHRFLQKLPDIPPRVSVCACCPSPLKNLRTGRSQRPTSNFF